MKKNAFILILLSVFFFAWACNKEKVIDSTPPLGLWEELVWIPGINDDGDTVPLRMIWDEMIYLGFYDSVVCTATQIQFPNVSTTRGSIRMQIRYYNGIAPEDSATMDCYNRYSNDYVTGSYTIEDGTDSFGNSIKLLNITGEFKAADYTSDPDRCSSKGSFSRRYDFRYEDEEKKILRLGYTDSLRTSIQIFRKI